MTAQIIPLPTRASFAVRITREGEAWLVLVGAYGWLHGDQCAAFVDARWLSKNLGLPIRRVGNPASRTAQQRKV
jgi:hypothetical protein